MATTTIPSAPMKPENPREEAGQAKIAFPKTKPKYHETKKMKALQYQGKNKLVVGDVSVPVITEDKDVIVRLTTAGICGSDLHLMHGEFAGMENGDILGHEGVGIVESVGAGVENLKPGDRVVISAVIACGACKYCKQEIFSSCDCTNDNKEQRQNYGHNTSGFFGYSHMTGGYDGLQAEYARVPIADVNCLNVSKSKLSDDKLIFLSDVLCTGWHACELGEVKKGDRVAIWGCGPIGLAAALLAKFRGAEQIVCIDPCQYRRAKASEIGATSVIDPTQDKVVDKLKEVIPGGPDVCIDCVGFDFAKDLTHRIMRATYLETDTSEILRDCILSVRKAGRISVIGVYYATTNLFPIGAFMEKGLQMRGGQLWPQKYWKYLLHEMEKGTIDPTPILTHTMPLESASEAYKIFDEHKDNAIKVILRASPASHA